MALSGIFLILFLLFHASMNVALLFSADAYNTICELLGANWYAIAGSLVIAGGVAVHVVYASLLTLQNRKARGGDRYLSDSATKTEWSAKNMYVLGIVICLGLVLHLWNFWYKMQYAELTGIHTGPFSPHDGAAYVQDLFTRPIYSIAYLVWLVAIWLHLTHGVWSAFQTVGLNGKTWFPRLKAISNIVATIIVLAFASVPVYFMIFGCTTSCCHP